VTHAQPCLLLEFIELSSISYSSFVCMHLRVTAPESSVITISVGLHFVTSLHCPIKLDVLRRCVWLYMCVCSYVCVCMVIYVYV
jgi:hypothetical protein